VVFCKWGSSGENRRVCESLAERGYDCAYLVGQGKLVIVPVTERSANAVDDPRRSRRDKERALRESICGGEAAPARRIAGVHPVHKKPARIVIGPERISGR
jgi:hypothetical protein